MVWSGQSWSEWAGNEDLGIAPTHLVAGPDLAPPPGLGLTVDGDLAGLDDLASVPAVLHRTSQLQQLTEPNDVIAQGDLCGLTYGPAQLAADRASRSDSVSPPQTP